MQSVAHSDTLGIVAVGLDCCLVVAAGHLVERLDSVVDVLDCSKAMANSAVPVARSVEVADWQVLVRVGLFAGCSQKESALLGSFSTCALVTPAKLKMPRGSRRDDCAPPAPA
ncbi:unnamed protein product [Strongylus vulgaris]|uniref:Uncharacterized protein n=1 Tax=Strongylus vulgaris TaxID=40348 RepID=A0A3P7I0B2_STRVU|nr:unnamed protein product [Strongylus vulgaris]